MIKYKTIKNCGRLVVVQNTKENDNGTKVSKVFLDKLICGIITHSADYFDRYLKDTKNHDHIFGYRERQLHSVVCQSIADLTPSFVMEHPVYRKPHGKGKYSGHVDYWINYENYSFIMELKHCYFAYKRANSSAISKKFNAALKQLNSVKKEDCQNLSINKGLIKIALQAIVFYYGYRDDKVEDDIKERDFQKDFKQLFTNSSDLNNKEKVNFRSLWLLNERLVKPISYDNRFEIYPAVAFIGNVDTRLTKQ